MVCISVCMWFLWSGGAAQSPSRDLHWQAASHRPGDSKLMLLLRFHGRPLPRSREISRSRAVELRRINETQADVLPGQLWRRRRSAFIREASVDGASPSRRAAPPSPAICQSVVSRARRRFSRSSRASSRAVSTPAVAGDRRRRVVRRNSPPGGPFEVQLSIACGDDRALDDVLQLADVARPGVAPEPGGRFRAGAATSRRPARAANCRANSSARSTTSSPRSRSAGSVMGKTLSR